MFECGEHGVSFHLKRGYQKRTNSGYNSHNNDYVQKNIEEMKPKPVTFQRFHPHQYSEAWYYFLDRIPSRKKEFRPFYEFTYTLVMLVGQSAFRRHVDEDEEIIVIVHKHWLLGCKYLFWPIVTLIALWVFFVAAPYTIILYTVSVASAATLIWGLRNFYDYYLDAWIITNQGIIDVEWHGWFHRQSTRVLFSDVQGVSYEIQGVLGTMLRYGTIAVEKVSTGSVISLDNVKNPRVIEAIILRNMEGYLHTKNLSDAKHVQQILSQIVAREVSLEQFEDEDEYEDDDEDDDEDEYEDDDEEEDDR